MTATTGAEEAEVFWKVYVPARPTICSVNLINFGMVLNGTRATVEFHGVGPTTEFSCRLDSGQFDSCELCSVQFTNSDKRPFPPSSFPFVALSSFH